jgi:phosphoribosylanthranilate isomerase
VTWVKVCGLRTEAGVIAALDAGADAIGLVNIETSPRYIDLDRAAGLAKGIGVEIVLLTEASDLRSMVKAIERVGATAVQPYGPAASEIGPIALDAGWRVLRPVRAGSGELDEVPATEIPLIDAAVDGALGGTGVQIDPEHVPTTKRRYVLAGGLRPGNVKEAIAAHHPWGVDASSGLESTRGVKSPELIRAFIEEAKQA